MWNISYYLTIVLIRIVVLITVVVFNQYKVTTDRMISLFTIILIRGALLSVKILTFDVYI